MAWRFRRFDLHRKGFESAVCVQSEIFFFIYIDSVYSVTNS